MASRLQGKTVLITGASAGIGRSTAMALAAEGARLLMCGRSLDRLQPVLDETKQAGAEAVHGFALDVRDRLAVTAAFTALPHPWSNIDILVNNAGLARGLAKLHEDDIDNWEEMIDTNVKGLLYVTRAVLPGMVARNSGHIVNLGSTAGHLAYPGGGVYCATKAAERSLSDAMRLDTNGTAIRVTSVDPGMVETDFSTVRFRGDTARAAKVYAGVTPLTPGDIADVILWAVTRPAHVNIGTVVLNPVDQANAYVLHRRD